MVDPKLSLLLGESGLPDCEGAVLLAY